MTEHFVKKSETNVPKKPKICVVNEVSYVTRQIDTSIAILDSTEDTVVIEALVLITKYVDNNNNLRYTEQRGLLQKILNLQKRNKCIQRLVLNLLGILLTLEKVRLELDQDIYDEQISEICTQYIYSADPYIRKYCVSVLLALTKSCRIKCNIFSIDLFKPIMNTIMKTTDQNLLQCTLELFLRLLEGPTTFELHKIWNFDLNVITNHLNHEDEEIFKLSLKVLEIITHINFEVRQGTFTKSKLVEKMLNIVLNQEKADYHTIALTIINNCISNKITSDQFIETLEFLEFCQWAKTCEEKYIFPCILIIEQLTRISPRRQILFDFSVEDTILSFLRSTQKKVLNKTCEAIRNMMIHKYCCEKILTRDLMQQLFLILARKDDEEDPQNEVALKTILEFARRNLYTLTIMHETGLHKNLLNIISKGDLSSDQSFIGTLEIIYTISLHPVHQHDLVSHTFFERLLELFEQSPPRTAGLACQIMTNYINNSVFQRIFLSSNGPQIFTETLQNCTDKRFLKLILLYIYNSLPHNDVAYVFLRKGVVNVLKKFPEPLKVQTPLIDKLLKLIYNSFPSLKFFETGRLEVTDKLLDKFYLIEGLWKDQFPFLEDLEKSHLSTLYTVYVVDFAAEARFSEEYSVGSENRINSLRSLSTLSRVSSNSSSLFRRNEIRYGKLTNDPFLPRYIFLISKYIMQAKTMEKKITTLAQHINDLLCKPKEGYLKTNKIHNLKLHVELLKHKLGTNIIPLGFLKLGAYCERALYFKAIADRTCIPTSLVKGKNGVYWNEIALISSRSQENLLTLYVVDLMENIGKLLLVGSRAAHQYCNLKK